MPKRGAQLPWRLTTTWACGTIRTFTEALLTEADALRERNERLRIANRRDDGAGTFVITHRERPDYVAPEPHRCGECHLWGTEPDPRGMDMVCATHEEAIWEEMEERTECEYRAGVPRF